MFHRNITLGQAGTAFGVPLVDLVGAQWRAPCRFIVLTWVWCFLRACASHRLSGGARYEQRHPHGSFYIFIRYSFKELTWVWCFLRAYSSHRLLGGEKYEQRHPHSDSYVLNSRVGPIRSGSCFSKDVKHYYLFGWFLEALRWKGLFGRRLTAGRAPTGGSKIDDMRTKKKLPRVAQTLAR